MTTRMKEGRRTKRAIRAPAVWRGRRGAAVAERPLVEHGVRGGGVVGARLFSAMIVLSLAVVLALFFLSDAFYVRSIDVSGLTYMTKEEVFALADVANTHIFWVDPADVRESILRSPTIADAQVRVGWPPDMIRIVIEERQPAVVWEQAGVATWIDLQGRVMRQREDRDDLLRISVDDVLDEPLGPRSRVDVDVINGALQLRAMFSNIDVLRFNPTTGLGWVDGRGWVAWFGTGTDMPDKILVYNALVDNLLARGISPDLINVANPDAPYYSAGTGP
ncbi:MAG: FtsQ-type POTRA domain-containing protein [Chloroflexi bacterium]|nr:MAG: FtsQ-type POTRA domain-containing protein [Chloroflexota bacterium]